MKPNDIPSEQARPDASARKLVRGSSLLTLGRVVSVGINFLVQVLIVRLLMKAEYGAFAYGLAIASMGASLALAGLGRSFGRFVPLYQEAGDYRRMAGTIVLSLGCVILLSAGLVAIVFGFRGMLSESVVSDPLSMTVLLTLIVLIPLKAIDAILEEMYAVFAPARALFVRRHVIGPLLKLAAVLPMLFLDSNVRLLAVCYVIGGILGTAWAALFLIRVLRRARMSSYFRPGAWTLPMKDLFSHSVPLISTDLLLIVRSSVVVIVLEFFHGAVGVAAFRAVFSVARLNNFVGDSFRMLFTPAMTRLIARGDHPSVDHVYWRTMTWIAVGTYPLFLVCSLFADTLTVLLFGADYAGTGSVLAVLSAGFYFAAVFGINNHILRAHGAVGRIFRADLLTMLVTVGLTLLLVPAYGAVGGAAATSISFLIRPLLDQWALVKTGLVRPIDSASLRFLLTSAGATAAAMLTYSLTDQSLPVGVACSVIACVVVLLTSLPLLDLEETFPELLRVPLLSGLIRPHQQPS